MTPEALGTLDVSHSLSPVSPFVKREASVNDLNRDLGGLEGGFLC